MAEMMGDMMRGAAVDAVESVMDSGAMQVREGFKYGLASSKMRKLKDAQAQMLRS